MRRLVGAALGLSMALSLAGVAGGVGASTAPAPARFAPPDGTAYLGVSEPGGAVPLAAFDKAAGIDRPAIYDKFVPPDGELAPSLKDGAFDPAMTMMLSWTVSFAGGRVTSGADDGYIAAQVAAAKTYARPLFLRLDWEMNATWYPRYNLPAVTPAQYVASWRYIASRFAGVSNVSFVWAPNVNHVRVGTTVYPTSLWYPGDDVVNWIGLDAYPQYAPASYLLDGPDGMNAIAGFAEAHDKPLMLAEWAPSFPSPDSVAPIDLVFGWAAAWPKAVKALVYFDYTGRRNHALVDHPVGAAEFRRLSSSRSHFLTALVSNVRSDGKLQVSGVRLPAATVGDRYDARLAARGGSAPYSWHLAGLPRGLWMVDGRIRGAPRASGSYTLRLRVADSSHRTATVRRTLTVRAS